MIQKGFCLPGTEDNISMLIYCLSKLLSQPGIELVTSQRKVLIQFWPSAPPDK